MREGRTLVIDGIEHAIDEHAVVVRARWPLTVVSSALIGGGFATARAIVNLHVPKAFDAVDWREPMTAFVSRERIPEPYVGLFTSAWTERAELAFERLGPASALAIVTVGLTNRVAAGVTEVAAARRSTINAIVVVDADPEPAALVNAALTVTEVKTAALVAAGVRCDDGTVATGTSTDAVVVGATRRGPAWRFGGPISELGWLVGRVAHRALAAGIARWLEENG